MERLFEDKRVRYSDVPPLQDVLNRAYVARHWAIPDRHTERWVAVVARIHWDREGVEYVEAMVQRWTMDSVYVTFADARLRHGGVWLEPRRRRTAVAPDPHDTTARTLRWCAGRSVF